ncbi:hypothetical protein M9H77_12787 [Catharanthus roseus]|uniref:Uncharacterized protein n=1 Tax=Catharanthus roseus TaxID=4058 RepID=A0ACC0BIJ0_CATRO|nr:hypothetical protein M9H77_12787 [Catharanthus roseus]
MGAKSIKTWSLMKQALRTKFGVENHEGQRQGQAKEKFMKSSMGEKSTKTNELSQSQEVIDRKSHSSLEEEHFYLCKRRKIKRGKCEEIQPQFFNFLTTTCGTKSNHGMKAKGEGMGKELSIGYEGTSISLPLNLFFLCHGFSFKELQLFLELNASYVIFVGNFMVYPVICEQALDIDHMLKCSYPCAYLEKQLFVSMARIKQSYHDLESLHANLFFDLLVVNFSSSCASKWSKIRIFREYFVESGYDERINWFSWSLSDFFHAKLKGKFF